MVKIKYISYPEPEEQKTIEFQIDYKEPISPSIEFLLKTWKGKYFYYAMDDLLYATKENNSERTKLLSILNSTAISLQNNFYVNFFNLWIWDISINKVSKFNKFINKTQEVKAILTFTLVFTKNEPIQKVESLW